MASSKIEKLHEAASMADLKKVQLFLKQGVNPTKKDKDGCDALWAVISSFFFNDPKKFKDIKKIVILFIKSGCDPNTTYEKFGNFTPLISAASGGNLPAVQALIELNADINKADKYGYTPLHRAALNGYDKIVEELVNAGADPNRKTENKETVLKIARDGYKDSKGGFNEGKDFKKTISFLEKISKEKEIKKETNKKTSVTKIQDGKSFKEFQKKHKEYSFPPLLKSLFDYWDANPSFFAGSFELSIDKFNGIKDWFQNKKDGYNKIIVFGHDGLDSLIGFWLYDNKTPLNAPIVYLGGEGEGTTILSNTFEEFLSILATNRDWEPFDKNFTESFEEYEEDNLKFTNWLKSEFGIQRAKNPKSIVANARKSNPDLNKWISKILSN